MLSAYLQAIDGSSSESFPVKGLAQFADRHGYRSGKRCSYGSEGLNAGLGADSFGSMKAKQKPVEITVIWNDEQHTLQIPIEVWKQIEAGESINLEGDGYRYEGETYQDVWSFNQSEKGILMVEYDDGGVGFEGMISDAEIVYPDSDNTKGLKAVVSKIRALDEDLLYELASKAVETGVWVRKEDLPEVTADLLVEEGYIEDGSRLTALKDGSRPTTKETREYIEQFTQNALEGGGDFDFIPAYAISLVETPKSGKAFALLITFGYSFNEVRTELVDVFESVEEAKAFMRRDGFIN